MAIEDRELDYNAEFCLPKIMFSLVANFHGQFLIKVYKHGDPLCNGYKLKLI